MSKFFLTRFLLSFGIWIAAGCAGLADTNQVDANRLAYLDEADPFHPGVGFPRLTTPQWVGEPGVEAVGILSIDDMSASGPYEKMLRPIFDRLKRIEGRPPFSILCTSPQPHRPQPQASPYGGLFLHGHTP